MPDAVAPLRRVATTLALLLLLAGCATPRPSGPARLDDPPLQQYVQELVCRLASPCGEYEVLLVDARSAQAELLDDGRLAIRLGLLLAVEEEAELVFVLAHEIAHRQLGHRPPAMLEQRLPLELAADEVAVQKLVELGYPQDAGYRLIDRLRAAHGVETASPAAREQIERRLQALPRGERAERSDARKLHSLLARYRG